MKSRHFAEASGWRGLKGADEADGSSSCNCWRGLASFKGNLVFITGTIGKVPVGQDPTHLRLRLIKNANSLEKILSWIPLLEYSRQRNLGSLNHQDLEEPLWLCGPRAPLYDVSI